MAAYELPRRFRSVVLLAALLGIPALILRAGLKDPDQVNLVDRIVLRLSGPLQAGLTRGLASVHLSWRRYVHLVDVERENEQLRSERDDLRHRLRDALRDAERLQRYRRLLAFRSRHGVETVGARVIARPATSLVRALRIRLDRGGDAVHSGMPVVTADGVVGRIGRTYGGYSDVVLALDPQSAIDVVSKRTGARGLLRGADGTDRYLGKLDYVLRKEDLQVGDVLVTSGAEGIFPEGIPVGRVAQLRKASVGLYQDVQVDPAVDASALREVLVILAPPPPALSAAHVAVPPAMGYAP